jgi:predicted O-methyltransferase YrrM
MQIKRVLNQILPYYIKHKTYSIRNYMQVLRELKEFTSLKRLDCDINNLRPFKDLSLADIITSKELITDWEGSKKEIDNFDIPITRGGVNLGDRRALYYLIRQLKPKSVLEIGTFIGASTINIAVALLKNQKENNLEVNFTSVDITDVNSTSKKPWLKNGTKYSAIQMINELKCGTFVKFVTESSFRYLEKCQKKYDFIFIDGNHSASNAYQDIIFSLKLLNKNGIILLHDYFPNEKPLWFDGSIIYGPYRATKRIIEEGSDLIVLPLGSLPWETKLESNITSLALLLRKN